MSSSLIGQAQREKKKHVKKGAKLGQGGLSSEEILFPVRKPSGIWEDSDDQFSLVGSSRNPLVHTWGLILVSHSFWSLSIEGVMGSSVVTRSCRALKSFPSQGWSPV